MAWQRIPNEHGLYRAVDPTTGKVRPTVYARYSVRGRPKFVSTRTSSIPKARLYRADKVLKGARGELVVSGRLTVAHLLDGLEARYRLDDAHTRTQKAHVAMVRAALGKVHPAELVTPTHDLIEELQARWKREGVTNATINRRCNVLRRALRLAAKKGKLAVVPIVGRLDESSSVRGKYLPVPESERLQAELPPWVRAPFVLGYDLGIRKGQACRTRREYVDLTRGRELIAWPPAEAKQREPHVVPLFGRTLDVVRAAMQVAPLGCPYLFHGPRCKPGRTKPDTAYGCIGDFKTAFKGACKRAGLPYGRKAQGYTFHSTRHAASTNMRAGGMDEADAMKVTGHKTTHTFRHYEHGQPDVLREKMQAAAAQLARHQGRGKRPRPRAVGGEHHLRAVPPAVDDV
jgi:integrase